MSSRPAGDRGEESPGRRAARRLLHAAAVLWAAATLIWAAMFLIPGDPARLMAGAKADPETVAAIRQDLGLDRPAAVQYLGFMAGLARGDLGRSYVLDLPVSSILLEALLRTAILAFAAMVLALAAGIPAGVVSATRGRVVSGLLEILSLAGVTMPSFWLGLVLMILFAARLRWLPVSGYGEGVSVMGLDLPGLSHTVLPAITLAAFPAALVARITRASVGEELRARHVLAARARGLPDARVIWRHALRNAASPISTMGALLLASLLGGAVATEVVFAWPGIGRVMVSALERRDIPVVEGGVILLTAIFVAVNLGADLVNGLINPRARR